MKTKAKKFSHKLFALLLAVVMVLTCFTGVMTAYGQSISKRTDEAIEYNDLAWNVLSDEQVARAALDLADEYLPMLQALEPTLAAAANNADIPVIKINWDLNTRKLTAKVAASTLAEVTIKLGSVDELIETINSVNDVLNGNLLDMANNLGIDLGTIKELDLSAMVGLSKEKSACDVIRGILGIIYDNNDAIFGNLLRGTFSTGVIGLDIYDLLGGLLGVDDGYESNMAYNLVQSLLFNYTEWFTDEEIAAYKDGSKTFVYDDVLLEKMTVELLDKISVLVTYNDGTNSASRRTLIEERMAETGETFEAAAAGLGYDSNLIYSTEKGMTGNILLFAYGNEKIKLTSSDSLFEFAFQALDMAWNTVLKDTLNLVHVNYDVDRGHGSRFDNQYYYWARENLAGGWDSSNVAAMYSKANVEAWAAAVYEENGAASADEFLGWVKHNFEHDRTVAADAKGVWSDIDSTTLFNKLRYSPLADYYFDMQTGPLNLYLVQTGTKNLNDFFKNDYSKYTSLTAALNDCLVAAVKDLFPNRDNIYVDAKGDKSLPTLLTVGQGESSINDALLKNIANTLITNTLAVVQYVADTTDKNILNGFYKNGGTTLTEDNLESAIIPLVIACIGNVNLGSGRLDEIIHPADWDACKDAEAVAFVCLREYLSYILPDKDYNKLLVKTTDGTIKATLEGTLFPMGRDAVAYVMQGYVPVSGTDGEAWRVEDKAVNDSNTILDLLNSVICYYADNYVYKDGRDDNAMGVASLLGVCDANGESTIDTSKTLWQNVDAIANRFFPMLGELQGNGSGAFDSESLIWDDVVLGALDADKVHESGLKGISNFVYRVLKFVSADPIQNDSVVKTVYVFIMDLFNGLFGPRYNGQVYVPIPDYSASAHPFDDLMQKTALAGTGKDNVGAVQKLINNFVEFSGFGYNGVNTYPDSILPGIAFAITAVNSFITLIPDIAEHSLTMASATAKDSTFSGCSTGNGYSTSVTFKNTCQGVNNAYVDGMDDSVKQLSRYYVRATGAEISGPNSESTISIPSNQLLAPGESITLNSTAYYSPVSGTSCVYIITITYNIYDNAGNLLYENLKAREYQYLTGAADWESSIYTREDSGIKQFPEALESNSESVHAKQANGFYVNTTAGFASAKKSNRTSQFVLTYPEYVALSTDNLSAVDAYGVRARLNNNGGTGNISRNIYGVYYYDNKVVQDDATGAAVAVNENNAIPVFDKTNGDILYIGRYDVSFDGGTTWSVTNITEAEVEDQRLSLGEDVEALKLFESRTHVVYTLDQAKAAGIVAASHVNGETGEVEYIYLKSGSGDYAYSNLLSRISMRGPIDGFYYNATTSSVSNNASKYINFLAYDGVTAVSGTNTAVDANLALYVEGGSAIGTATIKFAIADKSEFSAVSTKLNEMKSILDSYKDEDFLGDALTQAQTAIEYALATDAMPLTPETALDVDKTERQFVTGQTTSETGDVAYTPVTDINVIPESMRSSVYLNEDNGIYYYDSDFKAAVYSSTPLRRAPGNVDAAGMAVTSVDGTFYHVNTAVYEKEWILGEYEAPYYGNTTTQATDSQGNLLYNQVQFKHYNANGKEVRNADEWVIAIPDTSYQIIDNKVNDSENRGAYTKASDYLDWAIEYVYDHINAEISKDLINKISLVRNNMNSNNFDVITYNKMVDIAKTAESLYSINITYNYTEETVTGEIKTGTKTDNVSFGSYNGYMNNKDIEVTDVTVSSTLSSVQVAEYVRLFNFYMSKVVERGYKGNQLEAEILCASGNAYSAYTVTPAVYDENGSLTSDAVVKSRSTTTTAKFGTFVNGVLVNQDAEGNQAYTDATWNAYVEALANAVSIAQLGNGSYAHKTQAYYNPNAEDYDAQITSCYTADTALQKAEIALTPAEAAPADTHKVSAPLVVAINPYGDTNNVAVNGDYTVTIYNAADDSVVDIKTFAMSKDNNSFEFDLESGSYYATIESAYALTRDDITITVGDADVVGPAIPIIACNFNGDLGISSADAVPVYGNASAEEQNPCYNLNGDSGVTAADAVIVYSCSTDLPNLTPVDIK